MKSSANRKFSLCFEASLTLGYGLERKPLSSLSSVQLLVICCDSLQRRLQVVYDFLS